MNKRGVSIIEILISALIFSLVVAGIMYLFVSARNLLKHGRLRMSGAELGKVFINPMQMAVDQGDWGTSANALNPGTTYCDNDSGHTQNPACPSQARRTISNMEYTTKFDITNIQPDAGGHPQSILRKVKTTINWVEPSG